MEYKKYNKLGNKTKRSRLTNMKDKLMIISGGGEEGRRIRVEDEKKSHVKLLKIEKYYRIYRIFH